MISQADRHQAGRNDKFPTIRKSRRPPSQLISRAMRDIVVIGASAGGVETLTCLFSQLKADLPASFFVVVHVSPHTESLLPKVLSRAGALPARHPLDKEKFKQGIIYVAPPDYHMVIEGNRIRLVHGPKENRHRPAIDPLFRTAAQQHGSRVIGIILSGSLDDGSMGLREVKGMGGVSIVQDPAEAWYPDMPRNARTSAKPEYCLKVKEISARLPGLVNGVGVLEKQRFKEEIMRRRFKDRGMKPENSRSKTLYEVNKQLGLPSAFVCPECNGPLWEVKAKNAVAYRCLVGHAYAPEHFLAAQGEELERALWIALRTLEESTELVRQLADRAKKLNQPLAGKHYSTQVNENVKHAKVIRQLLENM